VVAPTPKPSGAELVKESSRLLRGSVAEELAADGAEFSKGAVAVLKFHGIYQQTDRDLRKEQSKKDFRLMVRVSIPGGMLTPEQYLQLDRLAGLGDGTLRITSRGGIQYHYVGKGDAKELMRGFASAGLTTLAACGDVVRNVVSCAAPIESRERRDIYPYVAMLNRELKPKTGAYAEIWLDGEKAATVEPERESEPLYGSTYLPRKFKIGFAYPGENTTDIYSHDLGFVPHFDGGVAGFTLLAGGGMGQTNNMKATYPRLADEVCFVEPDDLLEAAKAVVGIHRDFGDRSNRKHARLKYVLAERGVEWFRGELESRLGKAVAPAKELVWTRHSDYLGWHPQEQDGRPVERWFYGLRVVSGRVAGSVRSGIREVVERLRPEVRLTAQQNLIFAGLREGERAELDGILRKHGVVGPESLPPVLRLSMACPALPTCGLSLAESERTLPSLAAEVQAELDGLGLGQEPVHLRMTGCPNGCARPYTAEIGIVGQSPALYSVYLGGSPMATRLNQLLSHGIRREKIASTLRPILAEYRESGGGESFGDWCHRVGVDRLRERHVPEAKV
jgi:sulfite reductase (ferredoxin)